MANITPTLHASYARTHNEAPIVNEYGVQAEYHKNGFCPYHPDIQLRKKKRFGVWKTVRDSCPKCDRMNSTQQGPTSPATPVPQQSPSFPATQIQPPTQIQTTSIPSPIAEILSKMRINERNANIQKEGLFELQNLAINENNRVTIAEAGGITTILSAMKTHSSNATVQEKGCGALLSTGTRYQAPGTCN